MRNGLLAQAFPAVNFEVSQEDGRLIDQIATRGVKLHKELTGEDDDRLTTEMDITAVHANGCPLNLAKFLAFDDFNFAHDFYGIRNYVDRETGQLMDCFLPRCARLS